MKRKHSLLFLCLIASLKINAQCSGVDSTGKIALPPLSVEKSLTYNIWHGFTLIPGSATLPVVKTISYNHSFVNEGIGCKTGKTLPFSQPLGYDKFKNDTMIGNHIYNDTLLVNYKERSISTSGTMGTITDSAFSSSCVSKAKASTCITINPYAAGVPISGEIQNYGFGQSVNPPLASDAYAISLGDVTAESTKKLRSGTIIWIPWTVSTSSGKGHGVRQKAGTSDPITYFVHDYVTGQDTSGTLLTITMIFYTDTDTVTYTNLWKNDFVRIESKATEFHIAFPSTLTNLQGSLFVKVNNGFVVQATATGFFSSVPLPLLGTPTPIVFPLQNMLQFNYNLGNFNDDSLLVQINMYGNSINNNAASNIMFNINDSIIKPKCNNENNGAIFLNVSGDYPPFTYLWNGGSTNQNRLNIKAKTYTVTVTDANGNTKSKSILVSQPAPLKINFKTTAVKCGGNATGSSIATISGGTSPYSYLWNTGDFTTTITSKPTGSYILMVTDSNLCVHSGTTFIAENPALSLVVLPLGNDSAKAIGSGGVPLLSYKWFTSPQQFTDKATGLIGGTTYKVKVTDSKNCTATIFYTHPFSRITNRGTEENIFSITPNLTTGFVTLNFENSKGPHFVRLFNLTGKLLFDKEIKEDGLEYDLDISWLQQGIYFCSVNDGEQTKTIKLVKH